MAETECVLTLLMGLKSHNTYNEANKYVEL